MEKIRRASALGPRYLTFEVEGEVYAIPILKVKEILGARDITPLPQTPPSVSGVISLRGLIIPVVDLRIRFGLPEAVATKQTSIIVLDLRWDNTPFPIGIIVDKVREVQAIPEDKVVQLGGFRSQVQARYVQGVAETPEGIRVLIDVDKILSEDELGTLEGVAQP